MPCYEMDEDLYLRRRHNETYNRRYAEAHADDEDYPDTDGEEEAYREALES
jgi:hypothetical protein